MNLNNSPKPIAATASADPGNAKVSEARPTSEEEKFSEIGIGKIFEQNECSQFSGMEQQYNKLYERSGRCQGELPESVSYGPLGDHYRCFTMKCDYHPYNGKYLYLCKLHQKIFDNFDKKE